MNRDNHDAAELPSKRRSIPKLVIRRYEAKDSAEVIPLYIECTLEYAWPASKWAFRHPSNISLILFCAVLIFAFTVSLLYMALVIFALLSMIYFACREYYADQVRMKLRTAMGDINKYFLETPGACFWVAECQGKVVGMVGLRPSSEETDTTCQMFHLNTAPPFRRRGIGKKLVETVLQFAKDYGYKVCTLETTSMHHGARRLFMKMGFRLHSEYDPTYLGGWVNWFSKLTLLKFNQDV
ncbi:N-acetyltransferase 8-like [Latimeria chalumnae]